MKTAKQSFGRTPYTCQKPWPDDCGVQCGDKGLVLAKDGNHYTTAFFEAFPNDPKTFIRGEGATIEEAEAKAFTALERYRACPEHEFERRGYTNGVGFCRHCRMFKSHAFDPTTLCCQCNAPTDYAMDKHGNHWCETCEKQMPEDVMQPWQREFLYMERARTILIAKGEPFTNGQLWDIGEELLKKATPTPACQGTPP